MNLDRLVFPIDPPVGLPALRSSATAAGRIPGGSSVGPGLAALVAASAAAGRA